MPDWTDQLRPRLAVLRLDPAREAEIVEELSQHLDLRYDHLRAAGADDAAARRAALEELQEPEILAEQMRSLRQAHTALPVPAGQPSRRLLGDFVQDLRYAALRDGNQAFDGLAAWGGISASLNTEGASDLVSGVIVTGNFFDLLGVSAAQGRLIATADDERPGGHPVVVISHGLWQARFSRRPDIVGRDIRLNGHLFTIVGVTPAGFPGPQLGVTRDIYVPMMMQAIVRPPRAGYSGEQNPDLLKNPGNSWLTGLARLKPGVAPEQARAELATTATAFTRITSPEAPPTQIAVVPIDEGDPNQRRRLTAVAWLLAALSVPCC